jgi:transcriptional regulator with XRE-family HTH domain
MQEVQLVPQLGDRITGLLKTQRMSQTELAKRTGLDRADLNRLIRGKRPPRTDDIRFIADALEIPQAELVANVELPERVSKVLDSIERLEARALDAEQRASLAEAKLARSEESAEEERQANLQARLDAEEAYRTEMARVRHEHYDELVRVRQFHHEQIQDMMKSCEQSASENFKALQEMNTEVQRLRGQLAQGGSALETVIGQNTALRKQVSSQSSAEFASLLVGGGLGILLGAITASSGKKR